MTVEIAGHKMSESEAPEPTELCGHMSCPQPPDLLFTFQGGDEVGYCLTHADVIETRSLRQNSKLHINKIAPHPRLRR